MIKKVKASFEGETFGEFKTDSIVSQNSFCSIPPEQNLCAGAGSYACPRESYLTNTDNSHSTPVKNLVDFSSQSLSLYLDTIKLFNSDKKVLHQKHSIGLHKLKFINDDNVSIYIPHNYRGNSRIGWDLAKNFSNTDKARLSSKQNAIEKALANVDIWAYFACFTLDKTKQDRFNLKKSYNHLSVFLRRRGVAYMIVPEQHKKGGWHFHALLSAEIGPYLADFEGKALKSPNIVKAIAEGRHPRHCKPYSEFFGYNWLDECRNKEACVMYMTKYMLKTFDDPNYQRVSRRRYFTSAGLKTPSIIDPLSIDLNDFYPVTFSKHTEKVYLKRFHP